MKTALLCVLLTFGLFTQVYAEDDFATTQNSSSFDEVERFDALLQLSHFEKNHTAAAENLKLIEEVAQRFDLDLEDVTNSFIRIRTSTASENPEKSRELFKIIGTHINSNYELSDLISTFRMVKGSNDTLESAQLNFEMVLKAAQKCGNLEDATNNFFRFQSRMGSKLSSQEREVFSTFYGI